MCLQLRELSQQVTFLSDELARLRQHERRTPGRSQRSNDRRGFSGACWNCGKRGHQRRSCPVSERSTPNYGRGQSYHSLNTLTHSTAITVSGFLYKTPVTMLVDTGSAVTIVGEHIWKRACGDRHIDEAPTSPIVTANGDPLALLGRSEVSLTIGGLVVRYPVLIAKNLVQECILGADFLECFKCIVNIDQRILTVSGTAVPMELTRTGSPATCHVVCAETVTVPGRNQMEILAKFVNTSDQSSSLGRQTYLLVPKEEFMERQKVAVAHSIHSLSTSQTNITVRILNPYLEDTTIFANQNIGKLDPVLHVGEICQPHQPQDRDEIKKKWDPTLILPNPTGWYLNNC